MACGDITGPLLVIELFRRQQVTVSVDDDLQFIDQALRHPPVQVQTLASSDAVVHISPYQADAVAEELLHGVCAGRRSLHFLHVYRREQ